MKVNPLVQTWIYGEDLRSLTSKSKNRGNNVVSRRLRRYFFVKSYYRWRHVLLLWYSKASRYTALSCTDLADARFWIGSKIIWDKRIYLVKARFSDHLAFTLLSNKSCTNFKLHKFFLSPQKRSSPGLTVFDFEPFCPH